MTIPELIAFAIGAALVGIAWIACHWATIAARMPRTPRAVPVEGEGAARPAGDESCPEDCVCGAGALPLPTVRTVDLTPPEEER